MLPGLYRPGFRIIWVRESEKYIHYITKQNKAYLLMGKYNIGWKIVRQMMRIRAGFALEFGSDSHGFVGIRLDSRSGSGGATNA